MHLSIQASVGHSKISVSRNCNYSVISTKLRYSSRFSNYWFLRFTPLLLKFCFVSRNIKKKHLELIWTTFFMHLICMKNMFILKTIQIVSYKNGILLVFNNIDAFISLWLLFMRMFTVQNIVPDSRVWEGSVKMGLWKHRFIILVDS